MYWPNVYSTFIKKVRPCHSTLIQIRSHSPVMQSDMAANMYISLVLSTNTVTWNVILCISWSSWEVPKLSRASYPPQYLSSWGLYIFFQFINQWKWLQNISKRGDSVLKKIPPKKNYLRLRAGFRALSVFETIKSCREESSVQNSIAKMMDSI